MTKKSEKVILCVAGSRTCTDYDLIGETIQKGLKEFGITNVHKVIHGAAGGVDSVAGEWATDHGYNVATYPANWKNLKAPGAVIKVNKWGQEYNVNAGFARNKEMAEVATHLIAINLGTNGTDNMVEEMTKLGKPVYEYRPSYLEDDEFEEYDFWGKLHAALRL
jgi:hypothetical protein